MMQAQEAVSRIKVNAQKQLTCVHTFLTSVQQLLSRDLLNLHFLIYFEVLTLVVWLLLYFHLLPVIDFIVCLLMESGGRHSPMLSSGYILSWNSSKSVINMSPCCSQKSSGFLILTDLTGILYEGAMIFLFIELMWIHLNVTPGARFFFYYLH